MKRHLLACAATVLLLASPAFAQGTESALTAESAKEQVAKPVAVAKDHVKKEEKETMAKEVKAPEMPKAHAKAEALKADHAKALEAKKTLEKEASKPETKESLPTATATGTAETK